MAAAASGDCGPPADAAGGVGGTFLQAVHYQMHPLHIANDFPQDIQRSPQSLTGKKYLFYLFMNVLDSQK